MHPNEKRERERATAHVLVIDQKILHVLPKIFLVTLISRENAHSGQDAIVSKTKFLGKLDAKVGIQKEVSLAARPTLVQ